MGGLRPIELTHPGLLIWSRIEAGRNNPRFQSASPTLCPSDKLAPTYPFDLFITLGSKGHLLSNPGAAAKEQQTEKYREKTI